MNPHFDGARPASATAQPVIPPEPQAAHAGSYLGPSAQPHEIFELDGGWDTLDDVHGKDIGRQSAETPSMAGYAQPEEAPGANPWRTESPDFTHQRQGANSLDLSKLSVQPEESRPRSPSSKNPFLRKTVPQSQPLQLESSTDLIDLQAEQSPWQEEASSRPEQPRPVNTDEPGSHLHGLDYVGGLVSEQDPHMHGNGKGKEPAYLGGVPSAEAQSSVNPRPASPGVIKREEQDEVYQIKNIRWYDANTQQNPRHSPVLVQNANGPCPLLALVNALVLSTQAELITPLINTLRTREQISLGFLLDAVFDELTSDRRRGDQADLPDMGDLYAFLVTLQTGMNVNPRFLPAQPNLESGKLESLGDFEATWEMKLYSTFSIPLIHGWLPNQHEEAFQAFQRSAQSYEAAEEVLFQEDDLAEKSESGMLSADEQALLADIAIMQQFFTYWPTQLTVHGLDVITRRLQPGQFAILFRNDHFSTLYREPKSGRLMTLVTDAGYASHDEIIWESLVDINGSESELYSGDFRSVSNSAPAASDGWQTVGSKGALRPTESGHAAPPADEKGRFAALDVGAGPAVLSKAEQEDHDLALALQLQEEEDQRARAEDAKRRRAKENNLSNQFIEEETRAGRAPRIPPRRSGTNVTAGPAGTTPATNATTRNADDELGPPPYEQAALDQPFRPGRAHPSSEHAPLIVDGGHGARSHAARASPSPGGVRAPRLSAASSTSGSVPRDARRGTGGTGGVPPGAYPDTYRGRARPGRIETGMNSAHADKDGDKCVVM